VILWTPNNNITGASTFTPVVKPAQTTPYLLTVTDANGCIGSDNALVTVIPYCIKVMNAFTPNNDGQNDRWLVTDGNPCTDKIFVAVYNRYGNEVYRNENYQNNWDGTYKGKPVADGTYYYNVSFKTITGKPISVKGDVTILR
nr:gliding motility-associated C-terminal domain-containing protein [Chitinophagaceae bacterium]